MSPRRQTGFDDEENLDRWLLTYADLITLLLAFFIVMYSISRIDSGKFSEVTSALTSVFAGSKLGIQSPEDLSSELAINKLLNKGNLGVLETQIQKIAVQLDVGKQLSTDMQARGLIIHISESAFFDPGQSELKTGAKMLLDLLSVQLLKLPNHLRVEGHTDNIPINTPEYPSNWELSTARAMSCLRYLVDKIGISPRKISASGYGQYRPLAANDTPEGRAKNRRVDIVILHLDKSYLEPTDMSDQVVPAAVSSTDE